MSKRKLRGLEVLGEAPWEASENLSAPEIAPSDGRITGRTKPLSLKATPEFHKELKEMAAEKECLMIEILEKALEKYKETLFIENKNTSFAIHKEQQKNQIFPKLTKKPAPKLNRFIKISFTCDNCHREFERNTVFSLAPNLDQLKDYSHYCVDCKEAIEEKKK